ncbi:MAG: sensor histidine kinase [Bacteroidota bacterium]
MEKPLSVLKKQGHDSSMPLTKKSIAILLFSVLSTCCFDVHAQTIASGKTATKTTQLQSLLRKGIRASDQSDWKAAQRSFLKGYQLSKADHSVLHLDFCLHLADLEQVNNNLSQERFYLKKASALAHKLKKTDREITALSNLGNNYAMAQEFDKSREYFTKSLQLARQCGDLKGESRAFLNIGNIDYYKGHWKEAVSNYVESAAIKEQLNDREGIAMIHNNIATIYKEQKRYKKSLEYYLKTTRYYEQSGDSVLLAETWINTAIVYIFMGEKDTAIHLLSKALHCIRHEKLPETTLIAHTNLAFAYTEKGSYRQALHYLKIAEAAATQQHDLHTLTFIANLYGANWFYLKKYPKAIRYYTQSYEWGTELGLLNEQQKALFGLYETEQKTGNFQQALMWHERYAAVTDSLFNSENQQQLSELEEKYDTQQKAQKITRLSARNKAVSLQQKLTSNQLKLSVMSGALVLIGIVFLSVLFYQRSKQQRALLAGAQQRHNEQVNQLINEQEINLLETTLEAEQNERKKLAKDIHDNLGSYLATLKYQHEVVKPGAENPKLQQHYSTTAKLISDACAEVRMISHQMATGFDVQFSLIPSINELIQRIRSTSQFHLQWDHYPDELQLPREIAVSIYKVIQELLSNVLKHARAKSVEFHLHQNADEINILFEDNGIGFNQTSASDGMGLQNMRERIGQVNGTFEINSQPSRGTTIVIIVPLKPADYDSLIDS